MTSRKRILVLGSTGSIGRQTLDLVATMPDRFEIVGLAAHSNMNLMAEQIGKFQPSVAALIESEAANGLRQQINARKCKVFSGWEGLEQMVVETDADILLAALVGSAGIKPTVAAIRSGKDIALANKETLVAAGAVVISECRAHGVRLLPVDSEHSALFQCLQGESRESVKRLILTASGGPFRDTPLEELEQVTVRQALSHPTWRMGNKITIDSATLMNKGLEIIEAHWLFDVDVEQTGVLIHPQSIVHSMVEFVDGTIKAQMGMPDMRLPILYALCYPERVASPQVPTLSLLENGPLTFHAPDEKRFPCLQLARRAIRTGGTMPAVMNAANEVAVEQFMRGCMTFMQIPECVAHVMEKHIPVRCPTLEQVIEADAWARETLHSLMMERR